ncbi:MAG: hypothetical protein ABR582_09845 [Gemmatimonadaceae bacterium]
MAFVDLWRATLSRSSREVAMLERLLDMGENFDAIALENTGAVPPLHYREFPE